MRATSAVGKKSDIPDQTDYGVGLRMVTEGGFVIRVDVANGGVTVIIGYPWESF